MSIDAYLDLAQQLSTKQSPIVGSPVTAPIKGREADMAVNHTGGFTFVLDMWGVLDRFIMIGSEGGGAYVNEKDLTKQSFDTVLKCVAADGPRAVARAVEYSVSGRAPKNDPALVVLALAAAKGDAVTQQAAYAALPKVARIGTHLFTFVAVLNAMGKWNAAAKRGVAAWYTGRQIDRLAVQLLKYQSRNGWSHRDVLRLAHVKPQNPSQDALLHWVTKNHQHKEGLETPKLVYDYEALHAAQSASEVVRLIASNRDISMELVPTQFLKDPSVLEALLPSMGLTATVRMLGRLAAAGVTKPMSSATKLVVSKLSNVEDLKAQRLHPITILQALKQYSAGRGEKGSLIWTPSQTIIDVLDEAFYASFASVEDTGMGVMLGVDCSASMSWESAKVCGSPNLYARDVAACMALVLAKTQRNHFIGGFGSHLLELKISPNMRLEQVIKIMSNQQFGATNIALPMQHAEAHKMDGVDLFMVITDNEVNCGTAHPAQALRSYRARYVPTAKLAVMGTSVSQFTVADPKDGGMMDIAGFDSATPQILADFAMRGRS